MKNNILLSLLVAMLFAAMFVINTSDPFLCNKVEIISKYKPIKDADCGGFYALDSVSQYLQDTNYYNLKFIGTEMLIQKNKLIGYDKFREQLFGKKASNRDEINNLSCIDSTGMNIRLEGGNFEGPEKIYLRMESVEERRFVFLPNIILYHLVNKRLD